jgi:hypothetical protein
MKDRLTNITFLAILFLLSDNIYPLTWPIPKGTSGRYSITSTLGEFRSATRTHKGIDIGVSYSPVVSPVDGVITIKKKMMVRRVTGLKSKVLMVFYIDFII